MANALGYVKPKKNQEFEKKVYGIGTVKAGKNKVRVVIHDKSGEEIFNNLFGFDALPKVPHIAPDSGVHEFNIVLSPEKDTVEKLGPVEGHYLACLVDFVRSEEGADPTPMLIEKEDKDGKPYSYEQFMADFEVVKGPFKGVLIRHWLRYKFVEDPDNPGFAGWDGDPSNPNAKHLPRLVDFCEKIGATDEPIEWPEDGNVLPEILRRGLKARKVVDLTVKKGFISDILAADYDELGEKATVKKPAAKKVPAKASKKEVDPDEDL